jgi:hypothetical protein
VEVKLGNAVCLEHWYGVWMTSLFHSVILCVVW